jgi:hypothetical protein
MNEISYLALHVHLQQQDPQQIGRVMAYLAIRILRRSKVKKASNESQ